MVLFPGTGEIPNIVNITNIFLSVCDTTDLRKMYVHRVTSVAQRKKSESPTGIDRTYTYDLPHTGRML